MAQHYWFILWKSSFEFNEVLRDSHLEEQ